MSFERELQPGEMVVFKSERIRVTRRPDGGQHVDTYLESGYIGPRNEVLSNQDNTFIFVWTQGVVVWEKDKEPVFIEDGIAQPPKTSLEAQRRFALDTYLARRRE